MKVAIIGRSELLYDTAMLLLEKGYIIPLIITAKEAPEYSVKAKDFEMLAERIGAKFLYTPKINMEQCSAIIQEVGEVDISVSINYTGVIPQNVIDLFPLGILNAHAGDLPRYRGNAPLAWAILNREEKAGLCIHKMIGGELDSGNIFAKAFYPITVNTRIGDLFDWIEKDIPRLMCETLEKIQANPSFEGEAQSKQPEDALRCYPRLPEDGKIDWTKSNEDILRLINASSEPFGGAFCHFKDKVLKIWRAELLNDDENYSAVPGQVSKICEDGGVEIITGAGKLKILEVEADETRCLPKALINSIRMRLK